MAAVAALGCAICRRMGFGATPAEVHHQRTGTGAGQRASHFDTCPLCVEHHRGQTGIHGLGRKLFEMEYGVTEIDLIAETRALVAA